MMTNTRKAMTDDSGQPAPDAVTVVFEGVLVSMAGIGIAMVLRIDGVVCMVDVPGDRCALTCRGLSGICGGR
jgi:hypothetical protein